MNESQTEGLTLESSHMWYSSTCLGPGTGQVQVQVRYRYRSGTGSRLVVVCELLVAYELLSGIGICREV